MTEQILGSAISSAVYVAQAVLLFCVFLAVRGALHYRSAQRTDVALFMLAFAIAQFFPERVVPQVPVAALALLPVVSLRLVGHFRRVPPFLIWSGWAGFATVLVLSIATTAEPRLEIWRAAVRYAGLSLLALAVLLAVEARRSTGARARRLAFASAGGVCFCVVMLVPGVLPGSWPAELRRLAQLPSQFVDALGSICFLLAFTPPRRLINRWRQGDQADYLARVSDREPEERGWLADEDLIDGAARCTGAALVVVARQRRIGDPLVVSGATVPTVLGSLIALGGGLASRAVSGGLPVMGHLSDCEADLARHASPHGSLVLVAPMVAQGQCWGIVVAVHSRSALFPDDDLTALGRLARNAAVAIDHAALIQERREEARQAADRRLRELESRVGVMVDSIKDHAMLVLDQDGVVASWQMGAQHVFGYTRQQITRHSGARLFGVTAEVFGTWLRTARERGVFEHEGECRRFDDSAFVGVTSVRPLVAEPGMPPGFVVVTRDVTAQRSLEERVRQGEKMQAIGQLAGGVAHDFNNMLAAILGYAEWLEAEMVGDRRAEQVFEIQRAAGRAANLTRQLLAFSRRQMVEPSNIDLTHLVRELLPMLHRLITEPIEIIDATAPSLSPVLGDRSQVEQVVLNLVLNARDAMPSGGRITIRTADLTFDGDSKEAGLHGPHVLLEVSDTGVGMDTETRQRAFEPFFTTKDVGQGTGLGLATVYGIVQQMTGLVEIDSQPNRGTAVRVYLPHLARQVEVAPVSAEPVRLPTGREHVLLVEDDEALRTYLRHVLECNGYRVLAAEGPDAALALTESLDEPLQLVISDVMMPGMSGPELVAELLQIRPGLSALYMSGLDEAPAGRSFAHPWPSDLLQKPFSSSDLLNKVRQVLSAS